MSIPAIAFVGHHNAGKTYLLKQVISQLVDSGLRVGTVKHHGAHDLDLDVPGSDTLGHADAGSAHTIMVSPTAVMDYHLVTEEPPVDRVLARFDPADTDLILVEGYKHAGLPSIAVARSAVDSVGTLKVLITGSTVAVACDAPLADFVPRDLRVVDIDDVDAVCSLVREECGV